MKRSSSKTNLEELYLPNLSIDCVIFGYHQKQLKVLCCRPVGFNNGWLLPGGFVGKDENIDDAASRILEERSGVKNLLLTQFRTFGEATRGWLKKKEIQGVKQSLSLTSKQENWIKGRFVSIGYYALTEYSKVEPRPGFFDSECDWFDFHHLPHLLLDHKTIFMEAFRSLQYRLHTEPVGMNLLPSKFTLPELQTLYETILEKKLDQRNFTKKLISFDLIRKLDEKRNIRGHRPPTLYRFNKREYLKALRLGIELAF